MKFPLLVQRIFCISPFIRDGKNLVSSQLLTAYTILVIIGYIVTIALSILQIQSRGFDWLDLSNGYLWIIIVCFELFFTVISFPILLFLCLVSKNKQMQLMTAISKIDDALIDEFDVNFHPVYLKFVISQRMQLFVCSTYFAYIYYTLRKALASHDLNTLGFHTFAVAYILEQYVSGLMFWSLSNIALILRSKFTLLKQIQEQMYHHPEENATMAKRKLSCLIVIFKDICQIIDMISQNVGSIFVLRMAHDFTLLTSQCYIIFYILSKNRTENGIIVVMHMFVWMLQNVLRIGLTSVMMSYTVDEVSLDRVF